MFVLFVSGLWRGPWRIPWLGLCRGVRRGVWPGLRLICPRVKHRVKQPVRVLHLLATKAVPIRPLVMLHV